MRPRALAKTPLSSGKVGTTASSHFVSFPRVEIRTSKLGRHTHERMTASEKRGGARESPQLVIRLIQL
jgi:hypothetical protein